jgi:hypothetical protein
MKSNHALVAWITSTIPTDALEKKNGRDGCESLKVLKLLLSAGNKIPHEKRRSTSSNSLFQLYAKYGSTLLYCCH